MATNSTICVGASWWNHASLRVVLEAEWPAPVTFVSEFADGLAMTRAGRGHLVVWASKLTPENEALAEAAGVAITRVEDGFVRSVGLGAGLARGGCYVIDARGIYYDAIRPSDLEILLETADVTAADCARAARLREMIVRSGITKYNVGGASPRIEAPIGRERLLVVGQVAEDKGVRRTVSARIDCTASPNVNIDLLAAARECNPTAYIVYKPHPDVAARLRTGGIAAEAVRRFADAVITDADIAGLIDQCDRLVTLSSLSGFEALLRGRPVTTFGLPFYAGWGLTDDHTRSPRRTRHRSLDELMALSLVRYCRFVDPVTLDPCTPEELIATLGRQRASFWHNTVAATRRHVSWLGRKLGL